MVKLRVCVFRPGQCASQCFCSCVCVMCINVSEHGFLNPISERFKEVRNTTIMPLPFFFFFELPNLETHRHLS